MLKKTTIVLAIGALLLPVSDMLSISGRQRFDAYTNASKAAKANPSDANIQAVDTAAEGVVGEYALRNMQIRNGAKIRNPIMSTWVDYVQKDLGQIERTVPEPAKSRVRKAKTAVDKLKEVADPGDLITIFEEEDFETILPDLFKEAESTIPTPPPAPSVHPAPKKPLPTPYPKPVTGTPVPPIGEPTGLPIPPVEGIAIPGIPTPLTAADVAKFDAAVALEKKIAENIAAAIKKVDVAAGVPATPESAKKIADASAEAKAAIQQANATLDKAKVQYGAAVQKQVDDFEANLAQAYSDEINKAARSFLKGFTPAKFKALYTSDINQFNETLNDLNQITNDFSDAVLQNTSGYDKTASDLYNLLKAGLIAVAGTKGTEGDYNLKQTIINTLDALDSKAKLGNGAISRSFYLPPVEVAFFNSIKPAALKDLFTKDRTKFDQIAAEALSEGTDFFARAKEDQDSGIASKFNDAFKTILDLIAGPKKTAGDPALKGKLIDLLNTYIKNFSMFGGKITGLYKKDDYGVGASDAELAAQQDINPLKDAIAKLGKPGTASLTTMAALGNFNNYLSSATKIAQDFLAKNASKFTAEPAATLWNNLKSALELVSNTDKTKFKAQIANLITILNNLYNKFISSEPTLAGKYQVIDISKYVTAPVQPTPVDTTGAPLPPPITQPTPTPTPTPAPAPTPTTKSEAEYKAAVEAAIAGGNKAQAEAAWNAYIAFKNGKANIDTQYVIATEGALEFL